MKSPVIIVFTGKLNCNLACPLVVMAGVCTYSGYV